jgi:hypothetical protein
MNLQELFENFIQSRGFEDYNDFIDFVRHEKREAQKYMAEEYLLEFLDHLEATLVFLKKTCTGEY